jgi:hypothetical protein
MVNRLLKLLPRGGGNDHAHTSHDPGSG